MSMVPASARSTDAARSSSALAAPIVALLLGVFLLFGAGFAPLAAIHNGAHNARHSFAFPCH